MKKVERQVCGNCGKLYYKRPSLLKKQKISSCSKSCTSQLQKELRPEAVCTCYQCGKVFRTNPAYVKRRPNHRRFCSTDCFNNYHSSYCKIYKDVAGYWVTKDNGSTVRVHRLIMENHLGRKLGRNEHVNHIDLNKLNNRLENLEVLSYSEHMKLHGRLSHLKNSIPATCYRCGKHKRILKGYINTKYGGDIKKLDKWCCKECHDYFTQKYGVGYRRKN